MNPLIETIGGEFGQMGYCSVGKIKFILCNGEKSIITAGNFFKIEPYNDAEVIGDEICEMIYFIASVKCGLVTD